VREREALTTIVSSRLSEAIQRSGKSLTQLAEECGGEPSDTAIGSWRRGQVEPGTYLLARVADALGVTVGHLLGEPDLEPQVGSVILDAASLDAMEHATTEAELALALPPVEVCEVMQRVRPGSRFVDGTEALQAERRFWAILDHRAPRLAKELRRLWAETEHLRKHPPREKST